MDISIYNHTFFLELFCTTTILCYDITNVTAKLLSPIKLFILTEIKQKIELNSRRYT